MRSERNFSLRPATAEDFQEFYGRPSPYTLRAIVAVLDDEMVGFGGYYLQNGVALAFTDIKPGFRVSRKALVKGAHAVMELVRKSGLPVAAMASTEEPTSKGALAHFGFRYSHSVDDMNFFVME